MNAVVYTTNTGSTERYAKLLAHETALPAYSLAEAKKEAIPRCRGDLSGLDHGRLCQELCRSRQALQGACRLRSRHGTSRHTNGQRKKKGLRSSHHSAVYAARQPACQTAARDLSSHDGTYGQSGRQKSCQKVGSYPGRRGYAGYDAVRQ